ncbi:hypothetical protein SDC9_110187 [bioreactor metagenome]|uniref:Uncharacterized protein n=1 Tax=bioreactor metagenome TaxID=1076179 RepID=A0A645BDA2_9ZZZZ
MIGAVDNALRAVRHHAFILARGQQERQRVGKDHQRKQDDECRNKRARADIEDFFVLFHNHPPLLFRCRFTILLRGAGLIPLRAAANFSQVYHNLVRANRICIKFKCKIRS